MTATTSGNWIEELEEAAADRDLVAGYSSAY